MIKPSSSSFRGAALMADYRPETTTKNRDRHMKMKIANGSARYWSVYEQRWNITPVQLIPAREMAAMSAADRRRIILAIERGPEAERQEQK